MCVYVRTQNSQNTETPMNRDQIVKYMCKGQLFSHKNEIIHGII